MAKEKTTVPIQPEELIRRVETICENSINKAFKAGYDLAKQEAKDCFKDTEKRLYDYPILKENIEKYKLDIEDLKKETYTSKAKDVVRYSLGAGGVRLTREEIQETKILTVETKMERDSAEVDLIEEAMDSIKHDFYYMIIEYKYFDRMKDSDIAETIQCDESTVRRNKNRLVHRIAVKLYGSAARG